MSTNPYESPGLPTDEVAQPPTAIVSREKLRRVATAQLQMIWTTIAVLVMCLPVGFGDAGSPWGVAGTILLAISAISILVLVPFVMLVHELYGWRFAMLFGAAMLLLPGAAFLLLLVVNYLAMTYLRTRGVKAAFMGMDPATIL